MNRYNEAKEIYAHYGIDTEKALETLKSICISVHCWQGDDVTGFDSKEALSGGIQTTGNYLGKARTPEELMADYDKAFSLMPGKKKLNLHASYAIFEDDEISALHEIIIALNKYELFDYTRLSLGIFYLLNPATIFEKKEK